MPLNQPIRDWNGLRVWVLGGSTGIGASLTQQLLQRGAHVAVSARSMAKLEQVTAGHTNAFAFPCDVTDLTQVMSAARSIKEQLGGIDLAIYMAGYYRATRAQDFSVEQAQLTLQTNFMGAMHMVNAVLPDMLSKGHGWISLVASVAGYRGLPKSLYYGPSKAALINFAEALYLDCAEQGVHVSVVNPGFVETPMTAQNDFTMPALLTTDQAAAEMVRGYEKGEFEIHFPKRFTRSLKLLRPLPNSVYFKTVKKTTGM